MLHNVIIIICIRNNYETYTCLTRPVDVLSRETLIAEKLCGGRALKT